MPDAPGYAVRILKFDSNPVLRGNQRVSCGLDSLSGSKNNRKMRFETASRSSRWSFRCKILMLRLSMQSFFIIINFRLNIGTQIGADYENDNNVPY